MRCMCRIGLAGIMVVTGSAAAAQQPEIRVDGEAVSRACVTPGQSERPIADFSASERIAMIACFQREGARQLNAQLPRQIDDLTVLHVATTEGPRLTYHYKIALDAGRITADQRAALVQVTRNNVCGQQSMRQTMSLGGSYGYVWIDPANVEIARTVIEGC